MPTPQSAWVWVDLSPTVTVANNDRLVAKPAPVAGTIKKCIIGINTRVTTGGGVVLVSKNSVNILSAANQEIASAAAASLADATPAEIALTTQATSLKVSVGDMLKATWTLTTVASTNAVCCLVAIEPDCW